VKITPDGTVTDAWTGLTAVTDVELGPDGALYFDYPAFAPSAGEGAGVLVRVDLSNGPVSFAGVSEPMTCSM
jgi:hypothetical protein